MAFGPLVDGFIDRGTHATANELIGYVQSQEVTDEDVAYLARRLAESGDTLGTHRTEPSADVASTGGPGSLSTLLCPLYLAAAGCQVPKLAVPGRPAGGVDVMAQIPGYRYRLGASEVVDVLAKCGYAHFLADRHFAPRDAELFAYRRRVSAAHTGALAVASLLSKKIAAGVGVAGLDVRVYEGGGFGDVRDEARANAERFMRVASILGIRATCFINDVSSPCQPYLGRREALQALAQVVRGVQTAWLDQHARLCYEMARQTIGGPQEPPPSPTVLEATLAAHLDAQGASLASLQDCTGPACKCCTVDVVAPATGFLHIDLTRLRATLTAAQRQKVTPADPFPDPAGVTFTTPNHSHVTKGDCVAVARVDACSDNPLADAITACFAVGDAPVGHGVLEVINHG